MGSSAVLSALEAREVVLGVDVGRGPAASILHAKLVVAHAKPEVAHLSPVLAPAVANDPVLSIVVTSPSDNADDVVGKLVGDLVVLEDAAGVVEEGLSVDAASNGSTGEDLSLDVVGSRDGSVLSDGDIGVLVNGGARLSEGRAGAAGLGGLGLIELNAAAESLTGVTGAGEVAEARLVRDGPGLLGGSVRARGAASVAAPTDLMVKDVLDAECVGDTSVLAGNVDAVGEGAHGALGPATSAILGNVLVDGSGQVTHAVLVSPGESIGEIVGVEVLVRPGRDDVLAVVIVVDDLGAVGRGGHRKKKGKDELHFCCVGEN
mmetsp:Transcript_4684/g.8964  ORF Transcript_4684/g.8964 Transcript_4684/m.8964 type:complete len:319 (-) Transcript_4684:5-961(-)